MGESTQYGTHIGAQKVLSFFFFFFQRGNATPHLFFNAIGGGHEKITRGIRDIFNQLFLCSRLRSHAELISDKLFFVKWACIMHNISLETSVNGWSLFVGVNLCFMSMYKSMYLCSECKFVFNFD